MRRIELPSPMQLNLMDLLPESKRQKIPANQRFAKMLRKKRGSDCIEFTGAIDPGSIGYGRFREIDKIWLAHRFAYHLAHGSVPPLLRHRCNNPRCCNVAHLTEGTYQQNSDDMIAAGRQGKKLQPEQVKFIVKLHRDRGMKLTELAERYKVGLSTISDIVTGKTWKNVTGIQFAPARPHQRKRKAA